MIISNHKKWRFYYKNGPDTGGRVLAIGQWRFMFDIVDSWTKTKVNN